eukprot:2815152-Karenia_brevis.AAC.1
MTGKRVAESACAIVPKRLKTTEISLASWQAPGENDKRQVVVKMMSGRIIFHTTVDASMYVADLHRAVMQHYPGKAVSLFFKNNSVQLQWQLKTMETSDPIDFFAMIYELSEISARSFVVNVPRTMLALRKDATPKML